MRPLEVDVQADDPQPRESPSELSDERRVAAGEVEVPATRLKWEDGRDPALSAAPADVEAVDLGANRIAVAHEPPAKGVLTFDDRVVRHG